MKVIKLLCIFLLIISWSNAFAQKSAIEERFDTLNLKGQFEYVYEKSESYERYKVVKVSTYNLLMKNSVDSINVYKTELTTRKSEISELRNTVIDKDAKIKELTDSLNVTNTTKNSMVIFGAEISKGAYNSIMWGVILGLAVLAFILFLLFKRSHLVTNETKQRLAEVEEEYELHRKSALKREQKIARELMDEKLKHKF